MDSEDMWACHAAVAFVVVALGGMGTFVLIPDR